MKKIKIILKKLKSFISTNWPIKLACLGIAALSWIFVTSSQSLIGKYPGEITITTAGLSTGYTAIYDQKSVEVTIMAEPSVWKNLTSESFSATVDLSGLEEGTYEKEIKVSCNNQDVKIVKTSPSKIIVKIEKILKKTLEINPKTDGTAAEGLVAGTIEIVPETVEVSGPSSVVNNLSEAIVNIYLNKESSDFEKTLKIIALSSDNQPILGLTFTPSEALAKISIVKASNNKTVGIRVKIIGAPADGYYVSDISTTPQSVDITGSSSIIRNLNYLETAPISVSNISGTLEKTVDLSLPSGIALQSGSESKVTVKITLSETPSTKTISATLNPQNLNPNLRIASTTPYEIKVVVSGPAKLINELKSTDLILNINLQNLGAGSHDIALTPASVTAPDQIIVESLAVPSLQIKLSDK